MSSAQRQRILDEAARSSTKRGHGPYSKRFSKADAQSLIRKIAPLLGYSRDPRSSKSMLEDVAGKRRKLTFTAGNLQIFRGTPGKWIKIYSEPYPTAVLVFLTTLARLEKDQETQDLIKAMVQGRTAEKKKAQSKKAEKEYQKQAKDFAIMVAMQELNKRDKRQIAKPPGKLTSKAVVNKVMKRAAELEPGIEEKLRAIGKPQTGLHDLQVEEDLYSFDRPPYIWHMPMGVWWTEDGYSAYFVTKNGTPTFHLGKGLSFGTVDPMSMTVMSYPPGFKAEGDGYAVGRIKVAEKGAPLVIVTSIGATTKRRGAGTKLLNIIKRIAAGYGAESFMVELVTDEGAPFWNHMEKTGKLVPSQPSVRGGKYRFYKVD